MKVGDIIRVRYPTDAYFAGEAHIGVVTGTYKSGADVNTFWCFGTDSEHIVDIYRDQIEVISES
jgi:hypothetical protein